MKIVRNDRRTWRDTGRKAHGERGFAVTTDERLEKFDYTSAADQIARIERSKGRPATEGEKAQAVAQANKFIELSKQLEEASARADKWYQEVLAEMAEPKPKPGEKPVRARIKVVPRIFTDEAAAAAKARLRARFARVLGGIVRLLGRRKGDKP